jgi:DNA-directed RNA polymerase alpha subunit
VPKSRRKAPVGTEDKFDILRQLAEIEGRLKGAKAGHESALNVFDFHAVTDIEYLVKITRKLLRTIEKQQKEIPDFKREKDTEDLVFDFPSLLNESDSIAVLNLPRRVQNTLRRSSVATIGDLVALQYRDLHSVWRLGKKSRDDIEQALVAYENKQQNSTP